MKEDRATATNDGHASELHRAIRLEIFTVVWMAIEAVMAIGAGIVARSVLLTAFGIDSVIELGTGAVLLWRLNEEVSGGDAERGERAERKAAWIVAGALALLSVYVFVTSVLALMNRSGSKESPIGIGLSLAAVVVMPWLAVSKRRLAERINSGALRGDAASSMTCGYMAGTVLIGLVLNALLHWWWAEHVAALVFLIWLGLETKEACDEARGDE